MSIRSSKESRLARFVLVAIAALLAAGCATSPPVQEMSDARQAIAAAEEASAEELAPERLGEARRYLATAEEQLRAEMYGAARLNAIRARNRAVEALEASEDATAEEGRERRGGRVGP